MKEQQQSSLDILGIKPIADSINSVTTGSVEGAAALLSRICLPAAEEFGLLLRDRVRHWRALNIASLTKSAEDKIAQLGLPSDFHAHPRITARILEEGSWSDDSEVQAMWGGLLASSCTSDGQDDSNLMFIHILAQLSRIQARVINFACNSAKKETSKNGLLNCQPLRVSLQELQEMTLEYDIHRLDRELDHLRALELIDGGFPYPSESTDAEITPTSLALHMYARCQGFVGSPVEYFHVDEAEATDQQK